LQGQGRAYERGPRPVKRASRRRYRLQPIPAPTTTTILQLSDLHRFADRDALLYGVPTGRLLEDVLAHVDRSGIRPDHVVVTGDHSHDDLPETYAAIRELLDPLVDRLWPLPGNHDERATLRSAFPERIRGDGSERITFAFRAAQWLVLGLDTQVPGAVAGRLGADQLDWIREQLAAHDAAAVALFMHHPPVDVGVAWLDRIGLEDAEELRELLAEDGRIRLVCCGHVHHESSHRVASAEVVTVPSTGLQFNPVDEEPRFVASPPGYRIVELHDVGYDTRVVRVPAETPTPTVP
jgi:Icc protein